MILMVIGIKDFLEEGSKAIVTDNPANVSVLGVLLKLFSGDGKTENDDGTLLLSWQISVDENRTSWEDISSYIQSNPDHPGVYRT